MFNKFVTKAMYFYDNDRSPHRQQRTPISSKTPCRTTSIDNSTSWNLNNNSSVYFMVEFKSPVQRFLSFLFNCIKGLEKSFWIPIVLFLILLPTEKHVRSEPQAVTGKTFSFSSSSSSSNEYLNLTIPRSGYSTNSQITISSRVEQNATTMSTTIASKDSLEDEYSFENNTFSNTTVPIGDTAFLKCTIKNLGERSVYWIRRRDMHIIAVDKNIYSNDERFHVLNTEGSDDWVLQIKYVQKRDNGTYECQISRGAGIISFMVNLLVAVPEAFILGNGEYHIQQGNTINLVCILEKSPKPPDYIFWYHNDRMINYDKDRNLQIQTDTGSKTHSRLIIDNAQVSDSGNYTCHISNADPASTLVQVISQGQVTGDKMAAIQRRKSSASPIIIFSDYFPLLHELLSIILLFIIV